MIVCLVMLNLRLGYARLLVRWGRGVLTSPSSDAHRRTDISTDWQTAAL